MLKVPGPRKAGKRWARRTGDAGHAYLVGRENPRRGEPVTDYEAPLKFLASVRDKQSAWARAWKPYRDVLVKLTLPPRGPVGSLQNAMRTKMVCDALHKEKLRRLARKK